MEANLAFEEESAVFAFEAAVVFVTTLPFGPEGPQALNGAAAEEEAELAAE